MSQTRGGFDGRPVVLDGDAGRTAPRDTLRRVLARAPAPFLVGAIANPALSAAELVLLLRNRRAPSELLARIGRDRDRMRSYPVKRGVALHPNTPTLIARGVLPWLYSRDLAELAGTPGIDPVVRRRAEVVLIGRVEQMSVGERVSLARRATRPVLVALLEDQDEAVLRALLANPRMIESDAARLASGVRTPSAALAALAAHPSWADRRSVRLALAANPRTPVAVALGALRRLRETELERLAGDAAVPRIVRVAADRAARGGDMPDAGPPRALGGCLSLPMQSANNRYGESSPTPGPHAIVMSSFGEELRRERELREISLREVSEATKINLRFLEAMERNDFDDLPGGVFNRGYVRAYCQFIGVDAEAMVNAYLLEEQTRADNPGAGGSRLLRGARHGKRPGLAPEAARAESRPWSSRVAFWAAAVAVVLILLAVVIWVGMSVREDDSDAGGPGGDSGPSATRIEP